MDVALGLGPASAALGPAQQDILRQQLIKRLRVLMTAFMLLPIVTSGTLLDLNGKPGYRDYWPGYYAAFVHDPDGNNVEAVWYDHSKLK